MLPSQTDSLHLSRAELHELVWTKSMQSLAADYEISDVGLAKVCRRFDVPVPHRGYWRKKETGHPVRARALTKSSLGTDIRVLTLRPRAPLPVAEIRRREAEAELGAIAVAATLDAAEPLHPLVRQAMALFESRAAARDIPLQLKPGQYCLDIDVFPESLDRALRIFDALLKALEAQGHQVRCGSPKYRRLQSPYRADVEPTSGRSTVVDISGHEVCLAIREHRKHRPKAASEVRASGFRSQDTFVSSGELAILVPDHVRGTAPLRRWNDRKKRRLEEKLAWVVTSLPLLAEENERQIRDIAEAAERHRLAEIQWAEHRARLAAVARNQEAIDVQLARFRKCLDLRSMLEVADSDPAALYAAARRRNISPEQWREQIEHYIAELDPFAEMPDEDD